MAIEYKKIPEMNVVTERCVVTNRKEIKAKLAQLAREISAENIVGPSFCIFNFITSVTDGSDVTLGYPVSDACVHEPLRIHRIPELEVLSLIHDGKPETLGKSLSAVFGYADEHGIISDEFYREVFHTSEDALESKIEIQLVIHNWTRKLADGIETVLGATAREKIMVGSEALSIESSIDDRFQWVKAMLERLDQIATDDHKYDIISRCAHVFPQGQVDKLAPVFQNARLKTGDPLLAVDAVIAFMNDDPGWSEGGRREGRIIYTSKKPRDARAFEAAETDLERRRAYCYCPIVRDRMDQEMPVEFCYCGSGWFRQQWEGAIGQSVRIEIVKSILRGDDACEFAVHLPDHL